MDAGRLIVTNRMLSKYSIVDCEVVSHRDFGLIVRSMEGGSGYIDVMDISDERLAPDRWPLPGQLISCVVLGYTRDGRMRLTARGGDIALVRNVADVASAIAEWETVRDASSSATGVGDFFQSGNAIALLRWALLRPRSSMDWKRASTLLRSAPEWIRRAVSE